MTKRYACRPRPAQPTALPPPQEPRLPTYPERPLAFRLYPVGWWVTHQTLGFAGQVEHSDAHHTKIIDGALFGTADFVSCTARQVAALSSVPIRGSVPV